MKYNHGMAIGIVDGADRDVWQRSFCDCVGLSWLGADCPSSWSDTYLYVTACFGLSFHSFFMLVDIPC